MTEREAAEQRWTLTDRQQAEVRLHQLFLRAPTEAEKARLACDAVAAGAVRMRGEALAIIGAYSWIGDRSDKMLARLLLEEIPWHAVAPEGGDAHEEIIDQGEP